MCVYVASGWGHWEVEPEVCEDSVMEGWSIFARLSLLHEVRVSWVVASRQRILEALERERRVE